MVQTFLKIITEDSKVLEILAILLGPILAVQAQTAIDRLRAKKGRRISIFKTLMSTRATPLASIRVQALNLLDIEFQGQNKKDKVVLEKWRDYLDHLNNAPKVPAAENYKAQMEVWSAKIPDLEGALLQAVGRAVGHEFERVHIKRGVYAPQGHANIDQENQALRSGLIDIIAGKMAFPIRVENISCDVDKKKTIQSQ